MRYPNLRQVDLNLLLSFQALVEECNVTQAARRMFLSPSAMSRVFERLRRMFKDELLVRTPNGYTATHRALRVYTELELILPKLDGLVRGSAFDPASARDSFRIAVPDSISITILPALMERLAKHAPRIQLQVLALDEDVHKNLEANLLDLAILLNGAHPSLRTESLFRDEFVCLLARNNPLASPKLTMDRYLNAQHLSISLRGTHVKLIDETLGARAHQRDVRLTVPYSFSVALIIERTDMIATVSKRLAKHLLGNADIRVVPAPAQFPTFTYAQMWHPRYDSDPAHKWLRESIRATCVKR
jgi:DNA-binding transcriptional LysR family regulator